MDNPFSFSGLVKGDAFCNRTKEQKDLKNYIAGSQNVLLYSHRRFGKSCLIQKVFSDLKKDTIPVYVDLYGTTSIEDFIRALFEGLSTVETKIEKLMKLFKEKISSFTLDFTYDIETGNPTVKPSFTKKDKIPAINETFGLIKSLSEKKRLVIAFDEFQEIAEYGSSSFEKHLRKLIQQHDRVSYIFAGSQRHILQEMFSNYKRAFYKLATSYQLKKIEISAYTKWVKKLYAKDNRKIDQKYIETVVTRFDQHPMYIQEFFYLLWDMQDISMLTIDKLELQILRHREAELVTAWESLTLNQKRALKLVALTNGKNVFSVENMGEIGFKTASQVKTALNSLEKRDFISKNGRYFIQDVLFKRWIERLLGL